MVADGDNRLRESLEGLQVAHFEQLVDERAAAFVQQEAQERDAVSIERAIIDSTKVLRDKIIDVQAEHLRRRQATRLGRWLMTRRSIPEIRFGLVENDGFDDTGDMTVATAPLRATEEETVDGKISYGWVFELESPIPEVMAWSGHKDPPIHAWGRYGRSPVDIYHIAEDQNTGLQSKEKWFTVNPDTDRIDCWKLAEQRRDFFSILADEPIVPEEDQRVVSRFDEENGQVVVWEIRTLSREAEERERQRMQRLSGRLRERYAPDLETGLHLLGLIRGSVNELS